jgi:hypothetical protein
MAQIMRREVISSSASSESSKRNPQNGRHTGMPVHQLQRPAVFLHPAPEMLDAVAAHESAPDNPIDTLAHTAPMVDHLNLQQTQLRLPPEAESHGMGS